MKILTVNVSEQNRTDTVNRHTAQRQIRYNGNLTGAKHLFVIVSQKLCNNVVFNTPRSIYFRYLIESPHWDDLTNIQTICSVRI